MRQQRTSASLSKPLIGLAGKRCAGKSTAAEALLMFGFAKVAFADPVKCAVSSLLGISVDALDKHLYDETIIQPFNLSAKGLIHSMRAEWGMANIRESIWIDIARKRIEEYLLDPGVAGVVVMDIRSEAEARVVREMGGMVIHINRESNQYGLPERSMSIDHSVTVLLRMLDPS